MKLYRHEFSFLRMVLFPSCNYQRVKTQGELGTQWHMGHQLKLALGLVPADSATATFGPSPARRLRPEGTSTSEGLS